MNTVLDLPLGATVNVNVFLTDLEPAEFRAFAASKGTRAFHSHMEKGTNTGGIWAPAMAAKWVEDGAQVHAFGPADVAALDNIHSPEET